MFINAGFFERSFVFINAAVFMNASPRGQIINAVVFMNALCLFNCFKMHLSSTYMSKLMILSFGGFDVDRTQAERNKDGGRGKLDEFQMHYNYIGGGV